MGNFVTFLVTTPVRCARDKFSENPCKSVKTPVILLVIIPVTFSVGCLVRSSSEHSRDESVKS